MKFLLNHKKMTSNFNYIDQPFYDLIDNRKLNEKG